ncbi:MAG: CAP domain-containing protein [Lachnospiraceae bacterium]|nr:CAP domain-containing protein [Lachnospiraceae bacterium]
MRAFGKITTHRTGRIGAILLAASFVLLAGCGEQDAAAARTGTQDPTIEKAISELTPDAVPTDNSRIMQIERTPNAPAATVTPAPVPTGEDVSFAASPVLETKSTPTPTPTPDPEDGEKEKDPNLTGNGTPLVFDVGDATCIALGSFDNAMEAEILTAINAYRTRGNLKPLEANMSLEFCADTRSRESTVCFNHTRPNGSLWYTVAPAYYRSELLAKDYGSAQDTVDAWMSTATGREHLLNPDQLSVGISVFKHDGRNFIVASLGD